jgi:hypothetical protein
MSYVRVYTETADKMFEKQKKEDIRKAKELLRSNGYAVTKINKEEQYTTQLESKMGMHSTGSYEDITCKDCDFHESSYDGQKEVNKIAKKHLKTNSKHHVLQQTVGVGYDESW